MPGTIERPPSAPSEEEIKKHGRIQMQLIDRYLQRTGVTGDLGMKEWIVDKKYAAEYREILKINPDLQQRLLSADGADLEIALDEVETLLYSEDV